MDETTRRVLIAITAAFGVLFLALGVVKIAVRAESGLGILSIALGILWILGSILLFRRGRRH